MRTAVAIGGEVAQSVERATPCDEVPGSIPAVAARPLLVGSLSVQCDRLRRKSWSPRFVSCVAARKLSDVSFGTRPRYSLAAGEDVKKPTNHPSKHFEQLLKRLRRFSEIILTEHEPKISNLNSNIKNGLSLLCIVKNNHP